MKLARRVFAAVMLFALSARADDDPPKQEALPQRQANFVWDKNEKTKQVLLKASFSYRDVIDKGLAAKLASGLPTVIAMRAYVLREGDANPIALAGRTCRVSYDLWEEVYRLKVATAGGERDLAAVNLEGVLRQCAEARDLPVADKTLLTVNKPHFLGVIVEVNPISPQMLAQMRQWVSRPAGSTGIGPGDALFGSFVGLFVRQIGTADKTLRFRTQSVTPAP
ncbi:MAG: hypothetical protein KIT84_38460 [Labilithrix sp.]|nr:hypothetical protein [Labilithrix sp.]MCW5816944.1 hypothetical protein [Labilithrix sp.]